MSGDFLNLAATPGTYASDRLGAKLYEFKLADQFGIFQLRWEINKAAAIASIRDERKGEVARCLIDATDLLDQLEAISAQTKWITKKDAAIWAADMRQGFDPKANPISALVRIHENLTDIQGLRIELISQAKIASPPPPRSKPRLKTYVEMMAQYYEVRTGSRPPRSRTGPFARLAAAAWQDVGFSIPEGKDPVSYVGQAIERLNR
jgi:hypothetical protein